jgi:hypothetical protein
LHAGQQYSLTPFHRAGGIPERIRPYKIHVLVAFLQVPRGRSGIGERRIADVETCLRDLASSEAQGGWAAAKRDEHFRPGRSRRPYSRRGFSNLPARVNLPVTGSNEDGPRARLRKMWPSAWRPAERTHHWPKRRWNISPGWRGRLLDIGLTTIRRSIWESPSQRIVHVISSSHALCDSSGALHASAPALPSGRSK